jgi:YEATS domain-containing protein 4
MTLWHHLKLHPWTTSGEPEVPAYETALAAGPVHSWQYEEIVFNDPYQPFLNTLTAHPPTPLPKTKKRPIPFHIVNPGSLEASMGGTPEFTALLETDEARRLDEAKKAIVAEQEKMRAVLVEKEKELEKLRARIAES